MVQLPQNDKDLIFILNVGTIEEPVTRDYLGLSGIGEKCYRRIQYGWHFASPRTIPVRTKRIYDLGNILEDIAVKDLESKGIQIVNQQLEVIGFGGHWKGHIDGEATKVPAAPIVKHLLEVKSMADKYFQALAKNGLEESNPKYYDQMQSYMNHGEYERGLFVAYNKNTSAYYTERIYPDHDRQRALRKKESDICMADSLYPRIGNNKPEWYECKLCEQQAVCFAQVEISHNCRTCEHVDIFEGCVWQCTRDHKNRTLPEQLKGCEHYQKAELFITIKDVANGNT